MFKDNKAVSFVSHHSSPPVRARTRALRPLLPPPTHTRITQPLCGRRRILTSQSNKSMVHLIATAKGATRARAAGPPFVTSTRKPVRIRLSALVSAHTRVLSRSTTRFHIPCFRAYPRAAATRLLNESRLRQCGSRDQKGGHTQLAYQQLGPSMDGSILLQRPIFCLNRPFLPTWRRE